MSYEPATTDELRETENEVLRALLTNPALDDVDVMGAIALATATTMAEEHEQSLDTLSDQSKIVTATGTALTRRARELGVERREAVRATGVLTFSRDTDATTDYTIAEGTQATTADGSVAFETTEQVTLSSGTKNVKANARAVEGGTDGNLPADKLVDMPSPPTGVEDVTNPDPTGDSSYTDTDGNDLVAGTDREVDDELRNRVLASTSVGGAATTGSIEQAVLNVDDVKSVTAFVNETDSTDSDGLPPYSNEIIVSGGADSDIADALVDSVSVTELFRLQTNVVGNAPSGGVPSKYIELVDKSINVNFSRPVDVTLDISFDIATDDSYIGDDSLSDRIVDYVGGTYSDGSTTAGLGTSEDVFVDRIEDAIVGTETGVNGLKNLIIDTDDNGTDDTTTNSDGITVVSVTKEEQASVDASNITISEI